MDFATEPRLLEELAVFTPLGIRFWDPVLDLQVRDGLRVTAWPMPGLRPVTQASPTASGIYAFHRLPGLLAVENHLPEVPVKRSFVVAVEDGRRRFLPLAFRVDLPLPYRGVFLADDPTSPPAATPPGFHLVSAPTRPSAPELAVVRGELVERSTGAPASHARLQVTVSGGPPRFGLADAAGRFAVFLPQPTLTEHLGGSTVAPPPGPGIPLSARSWEIEVRVLWQPEAIASLPGTLLPDLTSVLAQHKPATVWPTSPDEGGSGAVAWHGSLLWGRESLVTTHGRSRLLVSSSTPSP